MQVLERKAVLSTFPHFWWKTCVKVVKIGFYPLDFIGYHTFFPIPLVIIYNE